MAAQYWNIGNQLMEILFKDAAEALGGRYLGQVNRRKASQNPFLKSL
jgi:hypothetical protein